MGEMSPDDVCPSGTDNFDSEGLCQPGQENTGEPIKKPSPQGCNRERESRRTDLTTFIHEDTGEHLVCARTFPPVDPAGTELLSPHTYKVIGV